MEPICGKIFPFLVGLEKTGGKVENVVGWFWRAGVGTVGFLDVAISKSYAPCPTLRDYMTARCADGSQAYCWEEAGRRFWVLEAIRNLDFAQTGEQQGVVTARLDAYPELDIALMALVPCLGFLPDCPLPHAFLPLAVQPGPLVAMSGKLRPVVQATWAHDVHQPSPTSPHGLHVLVTLSPTAVARAPPLCLSNYTLPRSHLPQDLLSRTLPASRLLSACPSPPT